MTIEGLTLRLYLDHNVDAVLAEDLRRRGFDAVRAAELGLERATDEEHLREATDQGRVLFTYDRVDYLRLDRTWRARGDAHAGIIVSLAPPRLLYGQLLRRLLTLLDRTTADEAVDQLIWLDERWDSSDPGS